MLELYAQAKLETPPSGPTRRGKEVLFSFVMDINEFVLYILESEVHLVDYVSEAIVVNTLSSCLFK